MAGNKGILEVGDVIHVQGRGLSGRGIRFFSRGCKEKPSWASHSAMVLRVGEEIEIIEALWKTVIRPIAAYKGKKSRLLVCRKPGGIDDDEKEEMVQKAEYYKGKPYGFWEIAFHALDRLVNNVYFFRRLIKDNDYPICSWLVAYVYDKVLGYRFGTAPKAAQPDDILDHCVDNGWEFVWADSKETVKDFCKIYDLQ
ncbi:MAG: C40 family peptidase [Planctomycetota bacterium]